MKRVQKWFKKLLYITLSIALMAAGVNMFFAPHSIAAGGVTGLAIIFESLFGFEISTVIMLGNAVILILCIIFLGREVFFNTVIGAILLPIFIGIIPNVAIVQDTMLSMIVGSVIFGIANMVLYNNNASSGGTSIPPLILKKYFKTETSLGLFITDGIVVLLSLLVFNTDSFFFAITSIFITSATMNYIESGLNKKKLVYIMSDMIDAITYDVLHKIGRGVTIIPAIGAYGQNEIQMLMIALNSKDYRHLVLIVNKHDKGAFMITDTVSDVHGHGWTYESGSV
ncbi:MAG: YitT family protein [Oscillospiraceae bacterium]|nr:YitT family protein [Oscillospiraceae bacterium]